MNIFKNYRRWRHSKGYGVHSPFAYRFVTTVIRPGCYGYYSYWEIDDQLKGKEKNNNKFLRLIRFTIRVSVFLKIKRIVSLSGSRLSEITARALNLTLINLNSQKDYEFQEGDLFIIEKEVKAELLRRAIQDKTPVLAINPDTQARDILKTPMERGLLLNDKNMIILIPRQEMAYISYDIILNIRQCLT